MPRKTRKLSKWVVSLELVVLAGLFLFNSAAAQLADTPWPMFRHDLQHTGRSPNLGAQGAGEKWEFSPGGYGGFSSPTIGSDGTIYVGRRHNLYAINPDGTKKWEFVTGDYVTSSPAIGSDGTIYVGSSDDKLYAISSDGTKKWEFVANADMRSPVIGSDGTIYVGEGENKFYAIGGEGDQPAAPSELSASVVSSSQINLSWTDNSDNETGFKIERHKYHGDWFSQIATVGADVTTYSDTGFSPTRSYRYRVRAFNDTGHSPYSNDSTAYLGLSESTIDLGDGGGGGCFIATAAYGSPMEAHVTILKNFRDNYLLPCALGRIFVRTYNKYSPPVAHFIAKHETLKVAVRISLLPVVGMSWMAAHFGPWLTLALMALLLALMGVTGMVAARRLRLKRDA